MRRFLSRKADRSRAAGLQLNGKGDAAEPPAGCRPAGRVVLLPDALSARPELAETAGQALT